MIVLKRFCQIFIMFQKTKKPSNDEDKPKGLHPAPFFLTFSSDILKPEKSKSTEANDQESNEANKSSQFDKYLKDIDLLCNNDVEYDERLKSIQFLILQLATLKSYSKMQAINEQFNEDEKQNYETFLSILNKHNLDLENAHIQIIDEIKKEFEK